MDRLAGNGGILHLTLSLPAGLVASRDPWIGIILAQLQRIGLSAVRTPWIASRHTNTTFYHVHVAIALRGFDGTSLRPVAGELRTNCNHQALARRRDLPMADYFDPGIPHLIPSTISRRLDTAPKERLEAALRQIFLQERPRDLDILDQALMRQVPSIERTRAKNAHGHR